MRRLGGVSSAFFALVGCGDDGVKHLPDGPPQTADAGIDGAPDVAPPPVTTVTTFARCCDATPGSTVSGVPVVVLNPDASVGEMGMTGADGKVTFTHVTPGSSITAFYPEGANHESYYTTYAGVKPGDALQFGDGYFFGPNPLGVDANVSVTFPDVPNATSYYTYLRCASTSGTASPIPLAISASCQKPTSPLLVYAYDTNFATLASAYVPAAPTTDGATPTVATWTPFPTADNITFTFANQPTNIYYQLYAAAVFGKDGDNFDYDHYTYGSNNGETGRLPTNGVRQVHGARMRRNDGSFGDRFLYKAAAATATTTDFALADIPWIGQVARSNLGVTWLQTPGTYDGALSEISWNVYDNGTETNHYYRWNVVIPPGVTQVSWSQFPAAFASYLPPSDASVNGSLELIDLSSTNGYDELRAIPEWQLACPECAVHDGEIPHADIATDGGEGGIGVSRTHRRR